MDYLPVIWQKLRGLRTVLLPLSGVVCIVFPGHLTKSLPVMLGSVMTVTGLLQLPFALRDEEHKNPETMDTAIAVVFLVLGPAILLMRSHAMAMIGYIWGLLGILKGTRLLNPAIYRMTQKQGWFLLLAEAAVQLVLGMMLLFHHEQKITMHIVILGIELLCGSVWERPDEELRKMPRDESCKAEDPAREKGPAGCAQQELQEGALASDAL